MPVLESARALSEKKLVECRPQNVSVIVSKVIYLWGGMGQAKYRGSQQQRIEQAKLRLTGEAMLAKDSGIIINNTDKVKNKVPQTTVEEFAGEMKLPIELLLEQLKNAGVHKSSGADLLVESDKSALLDHLRKEHGTLMPKNKITLTRLDTKRTIKVDVRKKRVLEIPDSSVEKETHTSSQDSIKVKAPHLENMESVIRVGDVEVHDLCARQEDDFFDRKSARIKPSQIQDVAVAFANAEGGIIVVGIEDDNDKKFPNLTDRWKGADHIEGYNPIIANLSSLNPSIDYVHQFLYWDGDYSQTYILKLTIRKSQKVHETAKGDVLLRKGAQSLTVKGAKIQELMRAKGVVSEEDTTLATISADKIIYGEHLKSFLSNLPITDKDPVNFALQENLLPESMNPTVALVLLFSNNPSADMPRQCAVRIVRYDTSEEEIERNALTNDLHTIEGPLHLQIAAAFEKLKEVIGRCECWTLDGLKAPAYPDEALYEVLVNSVLHRDYGVSDNVLISVYRNRIEFRSPGRLPGFVTVNNILDARFSRNPKLVRFLAKYPDAANKDLGEGINTVFERMSKAGFVDPILRDDGVNLYVTLKRAPKDDHTSIINKFVEKHGYINNRQALDILALESSEQATALFSRMREHKMLIREDEKQSGVRVRWVKAKTI